MVRLRFKLPAEGSPFSGTTRVLGVDVATAQAADVTEGLRELVDRLPEHPGIVPILDAGVADGRPFIVTPHVPGESLDAALRVYGPAALADALPRLQQVADALDIAAQHGVCHGALTPAEIIVSAEDTCVRGIGVAAALSRAGVSPTILLPYAAPELVEGQPVTTRSDQYALAAIAYEWLLGQRLDLERHGLDLLALPGVEAAQVTRAFERALASAPADRFATCSELVGAIAQSVTTGEAVIANEAPGTTNEATEAQRRREITFKRQPDTTDFTRDLDDVAAAVELPLQAASGVEPARRAALTRTESRGYGSMAIAAALMLGIAVGALAMRLYAPGSRSTYVAGASALPAGADTRPAGSDTAREVTEAVVKPPAEDVAPALPASVPPPDAAPAGRNDAGLLVHSTPAGALVTVDGAARGTTPVAVRGLDLGARTVRVSRPGYRAVERQVVLTGDRPSRTLEVQLSPQAPARPPAVSTVGSVVVDSRPAGARVLVDGRAAGVTPVTLALSPGQHTIRMERAGYRAITTRVMVKAGERTRVAARLEGGQDEE